FKIRIINGTEVGISRSGPVTAFLSTDSPEKINLLSGNEFVDETGAATFSKMMFDKGSHQHMVTVYFEMQVMTTDGREITLATPSSEPFIICTNINQWIQSENKIFKKVCFGEDSVVSWGQFEYYLVKHFTKAVATTRDL